MFTGLIEEIGVIKELIYRGNSCEIIVVSDLISRDIKTGDSVAVNGVCLTATKFCGKEISFDVMKESVNRTSLSGLNRSSKVNLERAVALGQRMGGHIVTGHVDCVGKLVSKRNDSTSILLEISFDVNYSKFLAEKGSVALDGVSLTVINVTGNKLLVGIIPHTENYTILTDKNIGDAINIEFDVLARYVVNYFEKNKGESGVNWGKIVQEGF